MSDALTSKGSLPPLPLRSANLTLRQKELRSGHDAQFSILLRFVSGNLVVGDCATCVVVSRLGLTPIPSSVCEVTAERDGVASAGAMSEAGGVNKRKAELAILDGSILAICSLIRGNLVSLAHLKMLYRFPRSAWTFFSLRSVQLSKSVISQKTLPLSSSQRQ